MLLLSTVAFGQTITTQIDLLKYLNLEEGSHAVYNNTSKYTREKSIDTLRLQSIHTRGKDYFYYVQNKAPMYFVNEHFIKGPFRIENDSLFYFAVSAEREILSSNAPEQYFLPRFIDTKKPYLSKNIFQQKVSYQFFKPYVSLDTLGISIQTATFLGSNSDTVYLVLGKGLLSYKMEGNASKNMIKTYYLPEPVKQPTGVLYINSSGDTLDRVLLKESYKYQSDFSTAIYNKHGQLIREDFYGTTGDQGVKFIIYTFDKKGRLIKEELHYTGSYEPKTLIIGIWVNEYYYNKKGQLIESRHKRNASDADYYAIETYLPEGGITANEKRFSQRHALELSKK